MDRVRRIVFTARNQVACVEEPLELDPRGVVLDTHYTCISAGTELAKLTGLQVVEYPLYLGNRAIGRVAEAPAGRGLKAGDLVFAHTYHQSRASTTGVAAKLPEALDRPDAALLGMASVALTGVQAGAPELGDWAVVTGAGLVGLLAAQLLELSGARTIVVDPVYGRRETAASVGLAHAVSPDEAPDAVAELTGGKGAELLLECSGAPPVAAQAPKLVRTSGTLVLVGSPRGEFQTDLTPFLDHVHLFKEHGDLTLKGAHEWRIPQFADGWHKHSMERNVRILGDLIAAGKLRTKELLSAVYRPEQAPEAYAALRERPSEFLGVVFDWTA